MWGFGNKLVVDCVLSFESFFSFAFVCRGVGRSRRGTRGFQQVENKCRGSERPAGGRLHHVERVLSASCRTVDHVYTPAADVCLSTYHAHARPHANQPAMLLNAGTVVQGGEVGKALKAQ